VASQEGASTRRDGEAPTQTARISADLRRRIVAGEFPMGERLPSEAALGGQYGATRSVIRGALARLARLSLVEARPRDGWIVLDARRTQGFARMQSFAEWALAGGRVPGGRIASRETGAATAREAQRFGIRLGEPLERFVRVRTLDERPVMVERSTWAPWLAPVVAEFADDVVSTTQALADAGIVVAATNHRIEVSAASTDEAALLGVRRSSPLLQVSRTTVTADGRLVEIGVDRYRAGVIAFEIDAGAPIRSAI
jgi:GntR family transcriptional regulator